MTSDDALSPDALLQLARQGEKDALGRLLDMYRSYLMLCARLQISRRLHGKAGSSDLVQETYLEASRTFDQFNGTTEVQLLAWLRQILVSRVAKLVRSFYGTQRRDLRLEYEQEGELDRSTQSAAALASSQSSPSEGAVRREQAVVLADALSRLRSDYREVIILRHFEELSFAEVATRMERTEESVKKLWTRALTAMRKSFGETSDEHA